MMSVELEHEKAPSSLDPKRMTLKATDLLLQLKTIPNNMFIEPSEGDAEGTAKLSIHYDS